MGALVSVLAGVFDRHSRTALQERASRARARRFFDALSVLALFGLPFLPLAARAQTLTIEVEARVSAPTAPAAPVMVRPESEEADPLPVVARPVVIVPPLESYERPVAPRALDPRWSDPPLAASLPAAPPPPVEEDHDDEEIQGYVAFGIWLESMDLSSLDLQISSPEIEALDGTRLSPDWAGNAPLHAATVGGAAIAFGMRAERYIRGPELRLFFGGSNGEGPWVAAPSGPDGLTLSVQSSFMIRAEIAAGLQVPLGPITPYVLGRASAGAAWIDVAVRDPRLGGLGTETVEASLLELGIEAGIEIHPNDDGLVVGAAFRGSFLGTPSLGGMVTFGYAGD